MPAIIKDVMTRNLCTLEGNMSAADAAKVMRDENIGDVIVTDGGKMCGIVTDRDLVMRVLAEDSDGTALLRDVCTKAPVTLTPNDLVDNAVQLMRSRAIRRLPVVEDNRPVGIITIGDLAMQQDPSSALADISSAAPSSPTR